MPPADGRIPLWPAEPLPLGGVASSLPAVLRDHAQADGARSALSYLERGEALGDQASYGELHHAAGVIAGNLLAAELSGRPVLLVLPQGLDFVRCFLGCLYAGVIAVPTPFPAERRSAARCSAIAAAARPAAILTTAQLLAEPARRRPLDPAGLPPAALLDVAELRTGSPVAAATVSDGTVAFLQYTSGSISSPKGVAITHGNIVANLAMIRDAFRQDASNSAVSWLPLHHDMGLIGCVLQPLFLGARCVLMSPLAFLQRPLRWLRAIDTYGATTAGAPNFAYDICVRHIREEDVRRLDLSRWRLAFCGSEPIRNPCMRRFADRFAQAGFTPTAQLACYGQAEATLLITAGTPGQGIRSRMLPTHTGERSAVSCGLPCAGTQLAILPAAEGAAQGEICVSGPQVSPGFWNGEAAAVQPDASREVVIDGRRFLRTGDVGCMAERELHVIGRLRDMLIVHGVNIHAEDVEATALEPPEAACLAAVAAFAVEGPDREDLVVVCETMRHAQPPDPQAMLLRISRSVADAHGVVPKEILLVGSGGIERTVSGKIQRGATRDRYLAGALAGTALRSPLLRKAEATG